MTTPFQSYTPHFVSNEISKFIFEIFDSLMSELFLKVVAHFETPLYQNRFDVI